MGNEELLKVKLSKTGLISTRKGNRLYEFCMDNNIYTVCDFLKAYNDGVVNKTNLTGFLYFTYLGLVYLFKYKYLDIIDDNLYKLFDIKLSYLGYNKSDPNRKMDYVLCCLLGFYLSDVLSFYTYTSYDRDKTLGEHIIQAKEDDIFTDEMKNIISELAECYSLIKGNGMGGL